MVSWQTVKDRLCFPILVFLSAEQAQFLGLTPIDEERVIMALGQCRGLLLDIGCGTNELARRYRSGQGRAIGVDVHPWPGADVVCDTTRLPFADRHFDTVARDGRGGGKRTLGWEDQETGSREWPSHRSHPSFCFWPQPPVHCPQGGAVNGRALLKALAAGEDAMAASVRIGLSLTWLGFLRSGGAASAHSAWRRKP